MTVDTTLSWARRPAARMASVENGQDLVTVDQRPGGVDCQTAIGVTVECDPEVGSVLDAPPHCSDCEMR